MAKILSAKLGTSVGIQRMDFRLPGYVSLYHVNVKDQQGQDMLYAGRLSASVDLLPLMEGRISISTAQLFSVHAKLYQEHADSKPNFQFVLDSLASKDTTSTSPLDLRINSLIMRKSRVSYDQLDAENTDGRLNTRHLLLTDISSHLILKKLTKDSLNVNIKRLSFKEQSGLQVDRLGLRFEGGRSGCRLSDFILRMPGTDIQMGDIKAAYRFRGNHFVTPSLQYSGSIAPSTITLADIACLLPTLKTFQSTLSLSSHFEGHGEMLSIPSLSVGSTTGDIGLDLTASLHDILHANPKWNVVVNDLSLSANTVSFISKNIEGKDTQVPEAIVRLGNIHLTGTASGTGVSELQTRNQLSTEAGEIALNFALNQQRHFQGTIDTNGFQLQRLLNDNHFGQLSSNIKMEGSIPAQGDLSVNANGTVRLLEYNGYHYQNIQLNGQYTPQKMLGNVDIDDLHLGLHVAGAIVQSHRQKDIRLTATVNHCSPQAIHLSDRWGDASFTGRINADFTASSVNDAIGTLDLTDVSMVSSTERYTLQQLHVESGYQDDQHYMNIESDFGHAYIKGVFDYHTLPQSFTNYIAAKLPTLPGLSKVNPHTKNNFTIEAAIEKSDWLQQLLQIPLQLTLPLSLQGTVNDETRQITLECNIPQCSYDGGRYENSHIAILSPLNRLYYELRTTKKASDGHDLNLQVSGTAHNNLLTTQLEWDKQAQERMSGKVTAQASFSKSLDGIPTANIHIAPSSLIINNAQWDIAPAYITYSDKQLDVSNFTISHEQQFLSLKGVASMSAEDSLSVQMRDIDVDYVLNLVGFDAVDFGGRATGGGNLRALFGDFEADGLLTVHQFTFEHGRMGTLNAQVAWNRDDQQIDIHALADDGPDALTHVEGYVSPKRNFIDLGIKADGTHLDFARSFTSSFISSVEGHGQGEVRLAGPLDAINLTGQLVLNGRAHVSTLNCDYEMRNDTLDLIPNEIEMHHCIIYDSHGQPGTLTGAIHHKELTNLTFDLYIQAQNLLAYDFRDFGDDTFYGTVYANGEVAIHGREGSVLIEADVTPQKGTVFVYNAASPDAISNQEFIQWGTTADSYKTFDNNTAETVAAPQAQAADSFRSDLTMRLKINATPDATIRLLMDERTNDYITLRGSGDLHTSYYNKGGFTMFGTYRVSEGTYGLTIQNIIHKNFVFREGGTIVFGGDPYDAALNLQAQHTVNGVSLSDLNVGRSFSNTVRVNCLMNITGQPRQPLVDFDLEMPNVNADEQQMVRSIINSEEEMNQQVVYLLAVGRFYPQGANNATETEDSPSKTSLAMQSLLSGTLSGQINNLLGQVIKSNNWNFGANISTGDEGWNNAEYEGLVSGRLLNNRLLINGQFGYRDNATTANPSFIGDFDIRYLLYPNGNLALKVYNQTNDRYFTRSSLNTQGIGLIMKKDFNGISDLLGIKRKIKVQTARNGQIPREEKSRKKR